MRPRGYSFLYPRAFSIYAIILASQASYIEKRVLTAQSNLENMLVDIIFRTVIEWIGNWVLFANNSLLYHPQRARN